MTNVSAIGEKFVFSHFLEPVSEEAMNKELAEIDAWLEADDAAQQAKLDKEAEKNADVESCKGNEACKESAEEKVARLQAELEAAKLELEAANVEDEQKKNDSETDGKSGECAKC